MRTKNESFSKAEGIDSREKRKGGGVTESERKGLKTGDVEVGRSRASNDSQLGKR